MEYERAIFRVYDRTMEGLVGPTPKFFCGIAQKTLLGVAALLLGSLVLLHVQFVNQPGCILQLLEQGADKEGLLTRRLSTDTWLPAELSRAGVGGEVLAVNNTVGSIAIPGGWEPRDRGNSSEEQIILPSGHALPRDLLVGVAIGKPGLAGKPKPPSNSKSRGSRKRAETNRAVRAGGGNGAEHGEDAVSANVTGFAADYTFAFEPMVLKLPHGIREEHGFRWVNITLDPGECMSHAGFMARFLLKRVTGYDVVMANQFMFALRSKGML
ncbi:unnamed protein product, partial [Discosporangium mesarthrocarpum]